MMTIRINHTSVSEDEVESSGIRPNHDGTFQLMKSVKINEDEEADCFVSHRTSKEPIIIRWGNESSYTEGKKYHLIFELYIVIISTFYRFAFV